MAKITTLFVDLGGVLLTNGWDRNLRKYTAQEFGIDWTDFEQRHHDFYDLHEIDRINLDEYLKKTVFWKTRNFSLEQIKDFIFAQSKAYPEMINLIKELKNHYHLKIVVISNEGRDLADYRIDTFDLTTFIDAFFVSAYVHFQKPDPHIYQMALDVLQLSQDNVFYIDDRPNLVEAAAVLGIRGIVHTSYVSTKQALLSIL